MGLNKTRYSVILTGFYFQALQSAAFAACLHQWWRRYLMPLSADSAAVVKQRRLHWKRNSQHAPWLQHRSVLWNLFTESAVPSLPTLKKEQSCCAHNQYGTIASKSRVSARVNKPQCLPSCHSLLFHAASSEPIVKGNDTAAGNCCNVALDIDATDKRSTLKQKPVCASRKNGMCFQCSDVLLSWKYSFTFSLKAILSFQFASVAHLAKLSYMHSRYFRKPLSPVLRVQQNLFFHQ